LYTLLASKRAGAAGRTIAFEPSPRERARLATHLALNRCGNVTIESCALGDQTGEADLFVVDSGETGCNSLRPGDIGNARAVRVPVRRLDDYVTETTLDRVDVIKIDVEGGELSALRGAEQTLRRFRPLVMCEIEEARTRPWGYSGKEIVALLNGWKYDCSRIASGGALAPVDPLALDGNYLARPR